MRLHTFQAPPGWRARLPPQAQLQATLQSHAQICPRPQGPVHLLRGRLDRACQIPLPSSANALHSWMSLKISVSVRHMRLYDFASTPPGDEAHL